MSTDLAEDEVFCRDCGAIINERAEICPECGIRQREPETTKPERDPGLAAVASFFIPGVGQIYNGEIGKGLVILIVVALLALTVVGLLLAVPIWLWQIYDAYKVAEAGGAGAKESRSSSRSPRTEIRRALTWYIDRADDPDEAKAVRKRFDGSKTTVLSNEDKEFIMDVVEERRQETSQGSPDAIRNALEL